jgi:hypothetical protein
MILKGFATHMKIISEKHKNKGIEVCQDFDLTDTIFETGASGVPSKSQK